MLKTEKTEVLGWEHVIRGMRNPKNSWDRTDSCTKGPVWCGEYCGRGTEFPSNVCDGHTGLYLGPNDYNLMKALRNAGTDHRKFMRMIVVYADITAPLYWWKEYDTYKVGTVANSCSTMHKIHAKEFTLDDFSHEHLIKNGPDIKMTCAMENDEVVLNNCTPEDVLQLTCNMLNYYRNMYNAYTAKLQSNDLSDEDRDYVMANQGYMWWQMIQLLPTSYNQKRTVMLNYEVLANIYKSRKNHKLDEWHTFCDWIKSLPYSELITGEFDETKEEN